MNRRYKVFGALVGLVVLALFLRSFGDPEGVTPLMKAARDGDATVVTELITDGANVNAKSNFNWTALMFAARQGDTEIVTSLLSAGADVNAISKPVTAFFATTGGYPKSNALSESIMEGHGGISNILIDHGAQIDAASMALAGGLGSLELLKRMFEKGADLNEISDVEWYLTALSYASRQGNIRNIEWLILNGADPNLKLPNSTNLSQAVRGLQPDAVERLIELGADPNQEFGRGRTVLWLAIRSSVRGAGYNKNLRIIEVLLSNGADPNYQNSNRDETMVESIERGIKDSESAMGNSEYDEAVLERYRRSIEYERAILVLLRAYSE